MNAFERALRAKFHRDDNERADWLSEKEAFHERAQQECNDERLQAEERSNTYLGETQCTCICPLKR